MSNLTNLNRDQQFEISVVGRTHLTEIYVIDSRFNRIGSYLGEDTISLSFGTYIIRFQEGQTFCDQQVFIYQNQTIKDPGLAEIESNDSLGSINTETRLPDEFGDSLTKSDTGSIVSDTEIEISSLKDEFLKQWPSVLSEASLSDSLNQMYRARLFEKALPNIGGDVPYHDVFLPTWEQGKLILLTGASHSQYATAIKKAGPVLFHPESSYIDTDRGDRLSFLKQNLASMVQANTLLTNRRSAKNTEPFLKRMVDQKWEDPWLGVVALHIHIQRPEPNIDLVRKVFENLLSIYERSLNPDLIAIGWWLKLNSTPTANNSDWAVQPIQAPPFLFSSWRILTQADASNPGSIIPTWLSKFLELRLVIKGAVLARSSTETTIKERVGLLHRVRNFFIEKFSLAETLHPDAINYIQSKTDRSQMTEIIQSVFESDIKGSLPSEEILEEMLRNETATELCKRFERSLHGLTMLIFKLKHLEVANLYSTLELHPDLLIQRDLNLENE